MLQYSGKIVTSHSGTRPSTSGDWLGLGDDVTDDQLNTSPTAAESPKPDQAMVKTEKRKHDDELSKILDVVSGGRKKKADNDDK